MATTFAAEDAYERLKQIEHELPAIALALIRQPVQVCCARHRHYRKAGVIVEVELSVTSCFLKVQLDDQAGKLAWFTLVELQLGEAANDATHPTTER